jgi:uncharacterized caspase-like protein
MITNWLRICAICAVLFVGAEPATAAGERVALVIGNAAYAHMTALKTPINDARLVADKLRRLGFTDVLEQYDLDIAAMLSALETFAMRAEGADWALIYYAGHGLELAGRLHLVPTDAKLASANDLVRETITLGHLLARPGRAKQLKLVILDMPRTNPFGSAGPPRLSPEQDLPPDQDVLIAFATQPGNSLADSAGDNGVYALALVKHMGVWGLNVHEVFIRVGQDVRKATNLKQVPWTTGTLSYAYYFVRMPLTPNRPSNLPKGKP